MKLPLFFCVAIKLRLLSLPCLFLASLAVILLSCRESGYPEQLVQADSAYVRGDYIMADSLLDSFDTLLTAGNEPAAMYYQLLRLEQKFVGDELTEQDFSMADSLCRYYKNSDFSDNYAKALLFQGDVYTSVKAYPAALKCYLTAADNAACPIIHAWAAQCEGDVYYKQEMYESCSEPYRRYSRISEEMHDTLRMTRSTIRMGTVYTVEDKVDSTISAFEKAMQLSKALKFPNDLYETAQYRLCDIYIQLGEYEKARGLMPRDSFNMGNWADWHYGQNHLDSAKFYFKKLLKHANLYAQLSFLRTLSQIELKQGHSDSALHYTSLAIQIEDSIQSVSQVEETRLTAVRHDFDKISAQRDELLKLQSASNCLLLFVLFLSLVIVLSAVYIKRKSIDRLRIQLFHEQDLRKKEEKKHKESVELLEKNKIQLNLLKERLNDSQKSIGKSLDIPLVEHIKRHAGENDFRLTDDEWRQLGRDIDDVYDHFSYRLSSIASLSEQEMRICYLIKLGVPSAHIALLLFKGKSTITMARKRLYKKITQKDGTPTDLNAFLSTF